MKRWLSIKNGVSSFPPIKFLVLALFLVTMIGGCSAKGKITNEPVQSLATINSRYDFANYVQQNGIGDILFILAFSGGGTRASALSYGVLEELRNTYYQVDGRQYHLLDEVDRINAVSGGSFTAAYYGLFGQKLFSDFKTAFLYKDIEGKLTWKILSIFNIIKRRVTATSRTEVAISLYDKEIFKGKTFADLKNAGGPYILINTTDLNSHDQFLFSQDYFDLLCSDLSSFKVARAVAASSAVPVLFDPILIENHRDCYYQKAPWLRRAEELASTGNNLRLQQAVKSINFYLDPNTPPYATLVDGGVTDNLGLRAILNNIMLLEGTEELNSIIRQSPRLQHVVVLVVNASTTAETNIGKSRSMPSAKDVLTAVTDIQLHRYNLESNSLLKSELRDLTKALSRSSRKLQPYFIELSINDVDDLDTFRFFNRIPTSFTLEKEQVNAIISTAKRLLRQNAEYQRFLKNLGVKNTYISAPLSSP